MYILTLVSIWGIAYPQYVWYKTFSNEDSGGEMAFYRDRALLMSTVKRTSIEPDQFTNSIHVIDENGHFISKNIIGLSNSFSRTIPFEKNNDILFASIKSQKDLEMCTIDTLFIGILSSLKHKTEYQSSSQAYFRYPYSIFKGRNDLHFISGVESRTAREDVCISDSVNQFVMCYNQEGDILWERSYSLSSIGFGNYSYHSNLMAYTPDQLITYGSIQSNSTRLLCPAFVKLNAITGEPLSMFYLELANQLHPDSLYQFYVGRQTGNIALTKNQDIAFCGLVDTVNALSIGGRPFVGVCDTKGNLKWFKRLNNTNIPSSVKVIPLSNGNLFLVFNDRTQRRIWIYIFDADGTIVQSTFIQNLVNIQNSPYVMTDALLTPQGELVISGNTSKMGGAGVIFIDKPFIAKVFGNRGLPYQNPYEGNMVDVAAYYRFPFSMYPNPSNGHVKIKTGEDGTLYLYDVWGRLVWEETVERYKDETDLSALPKGLYIYQFLSAKNNEIQSGKIIIE